MSGRIRSVKPEWLEDEVLALASSDARVLSIALLLVADDHGRGRANKLMLAGQVFPGKPLETLARALEELRRARYVHLYEVEGQSYFAVRNWLKHQRVDKPSGPRVPLPPKETSVEIEIPGDLANVPGDLASSIEILATDPDPDLRSGPRSGSKNHVELELDVCLSDLESFSPEPRKPKEPKQPPHHAEAARVFEAWKANTGHPGAVMDPKRLNRLKARLREGHTVETLLAVLRNWRNDPWLAGSSGTTYDGIEQLFRDSAQVERLAALVAPVKAPAAISRFAPPVSPNVDFETKQRLASSRRVQAMMEGKF